MSLSSQNEPPRPDDPLLVQLAERVAVRFALERFDHGDVKTNAVVELLDRLKREIGSLRNILKGHEEKMGARRLGCGISCRHPGPAILGSRAGSRTSARCSFPRRPGQSRHETFANL